MLTTTAIVNRKGGVGKTTTTVNLASYLAAMGKSTLIIDMDPQGACGVALGLDKRSIPKTIYNSFVDGIPLPITHVLDNLDIAPSNLDLDGAELAIAPRMARELLLKKLIDKVRKDYDHIVIDCPPTMGLLTLNALMACDQVIIPVLAEYHSLEGTEDIQQTLDDMANYFNHRPRRRFLVTMVSKVNNHGKAVIKELTTQFGDAVYQTVIPRNIKIAEAPSFGQPIGVYAPNSPGAKAYKRFAEEFLNGL